MAFPTVPPRVDVRFCSHEGLILPLILFYSETISMEEPDAFFPLLDILTNPDTSPGKEELSHEAQQQQALQTALSLGYLSKPGALEVVQAHLGLHSATPKIVAFYQHYSEKPGVQNASDETQRCGSWVDWYGEVFCEADKLIHLMGSETLDPAEPSFS
jgi:UDP-glucose:glycoprotein glucosyltransferase